MIVMITGCSSGIGEALALKFHERGFTVIATARSLESIEHLHDLGIDTRKLDVDSRSELALLKCYVIDKYGTLDILVNNAGYSLTGACIDLTEEQLYNQLNTNTISPIMIIKAFSSLMIEKRQGTIVNVGSISGLVSTPFTGAYCASKAALHSLSDSLRMELSKFNVNVITVQPGAIESKFSNNRISTKGGILSGDFDKALKERNKVFTNRATSAFVFADKLIDNIIKKRPSPVIRIGEKSTFLPLIKLLLPTRTLDKVLKRKLNYDSKS